MENTEEKVQDQEVVEENTETTETNESKENEVDLSEVEVVSNGNKVDLSEKKEEESSED